MKNLFTLALFSISLMSFGQAKLKLNPEEIVNENPDYGFSRPRLTFNESNPVVTWGKRSNKEVYYSRKSNGVWSTPKQINPKNTTAFAQDWVGPEVASNGNLVVSVFEMQPEGQGLIYASISTDGGTSFGDTILVTSNPLTRFPTVAIGPKNEIYVAFMTFEKDYKDPHYSVARYDSMTSSFSQAVNGTQISPGEVCDCCPANLVVTKSSVVLLFRNNDDDIRDIWAAVSTDQGATFDLVKPVDISEWFIGVCPSSGPIGLVDDNSIITSFMTGASGRSLVKVTAAKSSDLAITKDLLVSDGGSQTASQNYPIIAGQSQILGVVWQEIDKGKTNIKLAVSLTGIDGLATATPVIINSSTSGIPQNPDLVYSDGTFYVVWQDLRTKKVLYRPVVVENATASKNQVEQLRPVVYYSDDQLHIQLNSLKYDVLVQDLEGTVIQSRSSTNLSGKVDMDTHGIASGYYVLRFSSDGLLSQRKIFIP